MKHMTVDGKMMTMIVRTFLTKSLFLRRQRISMFRLVDTTIFLHISLQLNDVVGLNGVCDR